MNKTPAGMQCITSVAKGGLPKVQLQVYFVCLIGCRSDAPSMPHTGFKYNSVNALLISHASQSSWADDKKRRLVMLAVRVILSVLLVKVTILVCYNYILCCFLVCLCVENASIFLRCN